MPEMQGAIGGRIEYAFASAKARGEAAFVAFVTAGYPEKEGEFSSVPNQTPLAYCWLGHESCATPGDITDALQPPTP